LLRLYNPAPCCAPRLLQATHHKDHLYVATGEYWGYDYIRMPSVYWAVIKATDNLCELTRKDHGLIASQDGLALAYPVIAAREDGGALVAFSYSGKGAIAGGRYPAYPGATACSCCRNCLVFQGRQMLVQSACHPASPPASTLLRATMLVPACMWLFWLQVLPQQWLATSTMALTTSTP
jgi:hypothetical protein